MLSGYSKTQDGDHRLAALDTALKRGIDDVRAGRTKPAEEVFSRLEAKYQHMLDNRGTA